MNERNVSSGLRCSGFFGKNPIIGFILFVVGSLIFIILAYNLINQGPLMQWDLPLAKSFHALALNSSPLVINIMIAGYYIGKWGIVLIAILLGLYFLYKRFWCELALVTIGIGGSDLVFLLLSNFFNRPRPFLLFDTMIWPGSPNIPGFPSGHVFSLVVCCGFLVYLLWPKLKSYTGKVFAIFIALLAILFIGFSRLYIGDHYLTDIIAGYALGFAWLGLTFTFVELFFQRYNGQHTKSYK
jgi:membrane-associated phospholipid phosphatase